MALGIYLSNLLLLLSSGNIELNFMYFSNHPEIKQHTYTVYTNIEWQSWFLFDGFLFQISVHNAVSSYIWYDQFNTTCTYQLYINAWHLVKKKKKQKQNYFDNRKSRRSLSRLSKLLQIIFRLVNS